MPSTPASSMNVSKRPSLARRFTHPLALMLMAAVLAGAGWWSWKTYGNGADPREQYQLATVQRGDIEDLVTATGTVQPRDYVDVGAQVSGQLKRLHVEVGSQVQAGDLLAEIDPTVLKATADARRAGLRSQRATLTERQSALALAELQLRRQKNLTAADATTTEALQLAEAAVRSAKAQAASVQAQIEQTESALRADEANLNYARIYAPMTGTVVSVTARQGQTLNANQSAPTILRVADLRPRSPSCGAAWRCTSPRSAARAAAGTARCARWSRHRRSRTTWCSTTPSSTFRTPTRP
jgi:macrolide-specific efflux system membrane fusion protein